MSKELKFEGNEETTLNKEIALYLEEWEEGEDPNNISDYEVGNSIYNIKNTMYKLTEYSWTCNTEYHWYLKEITTKGKV